MIFKSCDINSFKDRFAKNLETITHLGQGMNFILAYVNKKSITDIYPLYFHNIDKVKKIKCYVMESQSTRSGSF